MIDRGTFKPGTRVPSLRRLSHQMAVSLTTAMEAYRVLEDRGLIEARPQSGFYVRGPRPLPPTPAKTVGGTEAVDLDVDDLFVTLMRKLGDRAIVPLGAAGPHPGFLPTDALNRILAREVRSRPETSQSYDEGLGYLPLRTQIARRALDAGCALGHSMPEACRERLVDTLDSAKIPVIEDDIYGELHFESTRPRAVKAFDRHLRRLRGTYRGLVTRMSAAVAEHFPEGTRMSRPRGGHVLWVEMPPEVDSILLFDRALRHGISLAPGPLFSACGAYRNFILSLPTEIPLQSSMSSGASGAGNTAER